jgi:CTP synthase (UTP-ammonia lyase)
MRATEPDGVRIALIGDHQPAVTAHRAIPRAIECAAADLGIEATADWLHSTTLRDHLDNGFAGYTALWCVPGSPYADTEAVLDSIQWAREGGTPFLGSCGGFQHAMLEYARNVLGMSDAAHAELDPEANDPVIAPLSCALVEQCGRITLLPGTRIADAYGALDIAEEYHCSYGVAPRLAQRLNGASLRVSARDDSGEVRAVELEGHRFFAATLFQSERRALRGATPPLVRAFVAAAKT